MDNFAEMLDSHMSGLKNGFNPGEKISATIISIGKYSAFIDVGATSEGILNLEDLRDKKGALLFQVGDKVDAYFVNAKDSSLNFTMKMSGDSAREGLMDIYEAAIPVEGKVIGERNGGYTVKVAGEEAFCPFSQIDMHRGEAATYIDNSYTFVITELSDHNMVVSRRKILEKESIDKIKDLQHNLVEGDIIEGTVTKVMPFGAFVNIGGMEGLIPMSEMAFWRVEDATEVVNEGQRVSVKVVKLDWVEERITLSLKQAGSNDPWHDVADKYTVGQRLEGIVTRLAPFGVFVEMERGVDGLVHISKLGAGRRINHPKEVVEEGATVEVWIESIDEEQRRISLTMEQAVKVEAVVEVEKAEVKAVVAPVKVSVGDRIIGTVENVRDFGIFVRLNADQTGLVHISQVDMSKASANRFKYLSDNYAVGSKLDVVVQELNGDRISLTPQETIEREKAASQTYGDVKDSAAGGLGSLGGMFDGLDF